MSQSIVRAKTINFETGDIADIKPKNGNIRLKYLFKIIPWGN